MRKKSIKTNLRKSLNKSIYRLTCTLSDAIPLGDISNKLKDSGFILLQEDLTEWSGFLCGQEGRAVFQIGDLNTKKTDDSYEELSNVLCLSWYKFNTGRYETVAYIS